MVESILDSIKQMHGVDKSDKSFDQELIMFTNGALMVMTQLGVGPTEGFRITSPAETWSDFLGSRTDVDLVFTDVYHRVRLAFDPPQNSFLVSSIKDQISECDWRIEAWRVPQVEGV